MAQIASHNVSETTQQRMIAKKRRDILLKAAFTLFTIGILSVYLMPLIFGGVTSLKNQQQVSDPTAPLLPADVVKYEYEGEAYDVFQVPVDDGFQEWALVDKGRESSGFVDPNNLDAGIIEWEGRWRTLEPAYEPSYQWGNYPEAWNTIDFVRLLFWTLLYAVVTMVGAVVSSAFVAYGFSRFNFPYKNVLFIILIGTIILPPAVTLVPTYAFFISIGWGGTWWPLIVPQFFANAYNVFLLRQYFMTIPSNMEEAAKIDGAGPLRTFWSVILPQAGPALVAVSLFHFFFAWNDFFNPLIYLSGNPDIQPITVGLTTFNGLYSQEPQLILAAAIITMVLPMAIFFMAQRVFIQGIVVTGSK